MRCAYVKGINMIKRERRGGGAGKGREREKE